MYYGLEEPVQAPTLGVWEMAPVVRYIAALKDLYDKALDRLDKFYDKYGDFYGPSAIDNKRYYDATIGMAKKELDKYYNNGEDPLKSIEGRMAIMNIPRNVNAELVANIKANAEILSRYNKNKGELMLKNLYDKDLEKILLNGATPETWDTEKMGMFQYESPIAAKSMLEFISPIYQKYAPREFLRYNKDRGKDAKYYSIMGVKQENQDAAVRASIDALDGTIHGLLFKQRAAEQAALWNQQHPDDKRTVQQQLELDIRDAARQFTQESEEFDSQSRNTDRNIAATAALYRNYNNGNGNGGYQNNATYDYAHTQFSQGVAKMFGGSSQDFMNYNQHYAANYSAIQAEKLKNTGGDIKKFINAFAYSAPAGSFETFRGLTPNENREYILNDTDAQNLVPIRELMAIAGGGGVNPYGYGAFSGVPTNLGNYGTKLVHTKAQQIQILESDGRVHLYDIVDVKGVNGQDSNGNITSVKSLGTFALPTGVVSNVIADGTIHIDPTASRSALYQSQLVNKKIAETNTQSDIITTPYLIQ